MASNNINNINNAGVSANHTSGRVLSFQELLQQDVQLQDEFSIDDETKDSDASLPDMQPPSSKRGRPPSDVWPSLTGGGKPVSDHSVCKSCKATVKHHMKSELAVRHLNKCKQFKAAIMLMDVAMRPDWFSAVGSKAGSKHARTTAARDGAEKKIQKSIAGFMGPKVTKLDNDAIAKDLAMFFYVSGTSFQRVEQAHLKMAFERARPGVVLPTRKDLSGRLLETCYSDTKKAMEKNLDGLSVCLTTDGWSNVNGDPIVNYMACTPSQTLFLHFKETGEERHTGEWIAKDLEETINKLPCEVSGVCTDNTAANKSAWKRLEKKFPTKFFHGCVCHGLNLVVKDLFGPTKTKWGTNTVPCYPEGFPFSGLVEFVEQCKDVVKFFRYHQALHAQLKKAQRAHNASKEQDDVFLRTLALPAATRWGSLEKCLQTLLDSEAILSALVGARTFLAGKLTSEQAAKRRAVKDFILTEDFVPSLNKCLAILKPIGKELLFFQSDRVPVSDVFAAFARLNEDLTTRSDLTAVEAAYIQKMLQERWDLIYGDGHGVAYLLDPRYISCEIREDGLKEKLEDFIVAYPPSDSAPSTIERQDQLADEFKAYQMFAIKQDEDNGRRIQQLKTKKMSVYEFWFIEGRRWPLLRELALRVFSLVASSAASERAFSTQGFIHSKVRNKLSKERVEMLMYIKTNYNAFKEYTDTFSDSDGTESDQS